MSRPSTSCFVAEDVDARDKPGMTVSATSPRFYWFYFESDSEDKVLLDPHGEERGNAARLEPRGPRWPS